MQVFIQPNHFQSVQHQNDAMKQCKSPANSFQLSNQFSKNHIANSNMLKPSFKLLNKKNNDISINEMQIIKKGYNKFSLYEDIQLKMIVNHFGPKNWTVISSFIPNKTAKQCRDRYMNYLAPEIVHSKWTEEEDTLLTQKYIQLGPCWSKIQKFLPFRSANSVKNRYKYIINQKDNLNSSLLNNFGMKINKKEKPKLNKVDQNPNKEYFKNYTFQNYESSDEEFLLFFDL